VLTLVGLPHGEDTNDVIAHGKGDHHNTPEERAVQNKAWLPILLARILGDKRIIGEHSMGILKIQAMFGQIAQAFVFVPGKFHEWHCMHKRCMCREGQLAVSAR
jgi:hypothetical protein